MAREADATKGAPYFHFGSKAELAAAVDAAHDGRCALWPSGPPPGNSTGSALSSAMSARLTKRQDLLAHRGGRHSRQISPSRSVVGGPIRYPLRAAAYGGRLVTHRLPGRRHRGSASCVQLGATVPSKQEAAGLAQENRPLTIMIVSAILDTGPSGASEAPVSRTTKRWSRGGPDCSVGAACIAAPSKFGNGLP
ncbi:hypothetical protein [Actinoplanes solisilvae]|uniref:hypothetical protein n=1 Tax=Actinoplanes solisilvae TaxID=2486853 RepID=UPI003D7B6012